MGGTITAIGVVYADNAHFNYIQISSGNWTARELYVRPGPGIGLGTRVEAGDFIGHQQPLYELYPGITEHVEVQLRFRGRLVDPGSRIAVP